MEPLLIVALMLLASVLQTTWAYSLNCCGAAPDLVLLLVLFLAMQRQTTLGLWSAFILGLLQDMGGGNPLGLNALVLLAVAYLVSRVRTKLFKENLSAQLVIVVGMTWAYQFGTFYTVNALWHDAHTLGQWASRSLTMSIYNACLGPLFFKGLARLVRGEDVYQHLIATRSKPAPNRWVQRLP